MSNNSTPKKKLKVSVFDLIIIVVAAAAVLIVYKVFSAGNSTEPTSVTETVRYQITLEDMAVDPTELMNTGDALIDGEKNYKIGTLVDFEVTESLKDSVDLNTGETLVSSYPGTYNAVLTIEADAVVSDVAIVIDGGYTVRAGLTAAVKGPGYAGHGFITLVERGDA